MVLRHVHLQQKCVCVHVFVWRVLPAAVSLSQGATLEPSLMRCCHAPCQSRPVHHPVLLCNKLLLDIRRHIKKYYSVSM